jgi:hypothetical protein
MPSDRLTPASAGKNCPDPSGSGGDPSSPGETVQEARIELGRPDVYVQRIQEITDGYGKGKPLTDNQIEHFNLDFADYREQIRQVQAQMQRQRGFSL